MNECSFHSFHWTSNSKFVHIPNFWLIAIVEFDTPHCGFSFFFITFFMYLINFSDSEWVNSVFIESLPIVFDGFSVSIDSKFYAYSWIFIDSDCKFWYCVLGSFFHSFLFSYRIFLCRLFIGVLSIRVFMHVHDFFIDEDWKIRYFLWVFSFILTHFFLYLVWQKKIFWL